MSLLIADVSEHQGIVDWATYGAAHPAVVVRAHNSNRPDNLAQPNVKGARTHCQWRGWYQYLTATADPAAAARAFATTVGPLLPGEVACLDLEEGTGDQRARRKAWYDALPGPVKWTYSGLWFARQHLPGVRVEWLAAYGQSEPADAHDLWQFTNAQRFAGITNPCDGNVFHGTIAQLRTRTAGTPTQGSTFMPALTEAEQRRILAASDRVLAAIRQPRRYKVVDGKIVWVAWDDETGTNAQLLDQVDVHNIAAAVGKLLPMETAVTDAQLEAALRKVFATYGEPPAV